MVKQLTLFTLLLLSIFYPLLASSSSQVLGDEISPRESLPSREPIHTTSEFSTKLETVSEKIERQTVIQDDPNKELDDDKVLDEGADGKKITVYRITLYQGEEYSREIDSVDITPPKDKIISRGTKIVWRSLDTPDGTIQYWRKLHVFATDYDSHCLGCDEWTATGMRQGKGVIAVDPKVIKLGSKLYVPGYGVAVAGDTGGAVRGDMIDLGFDNAATSDWVSHSLDVYLTN